MLNFIGTPIKEEHGEEGTTSAKQQSRFTNQTFGKTPSPRRSMVNTKSFAEQTLSRKVSKN